MIKNNLAVILAERNLKMIDVINGTGINKNTISSLVNNRASGIQYETLDKLCDFLDVTPGELLKRYTLEVEITDSETHEGYISFSIKVKLDEEIYDAEGELHFKNDEGYPRLSITPHIAKKLSVLPEEKVTDIFYDATAGYLEKNDPESFSLFNDLMNPQNNE